MAFKITIEKIEEVTRRKRTYSEGEDAPIEWQEYEDTARSDVYTQEVETLDVKEVINAVNKESK